MSEAEPSGRHIPALDAQAALTGRRPGSATESREKKTFAAPVTQMRVVAQYEESVVEVLFDDQDVNHLNVVVSTSIGPADESEISRNRSRRH